MSGSVVVKNTFICVVEDEGEMPLAEMRSRAKTVDVAVLGRGDVLLEDDGAEDEEMLKCQSAPAVLEASQRVAALAAGLEAGGAAAAEALDEIRCSVRALAFDAVGSCLVAQALEVARAGDVRDLVAGLHGAVGRAARSRVACRVLEQIVRVAGAEDAAFIAEELLMECPPTLALNANGSAMICRLLEYSGNSARTVALVDAALSADVAVLCNHKFGHEVAMSVLSNGTEWQRGQILRVLRSDVQRFSRHRFASRVFEQALAICSEEERGSLASEVLAARPGTVVALACHSFGVNVVRELVQVPGVSQEVRTLLAKSRGRVSRDKFGAELVRELGLAKQQLELVMDVACRPSLLQPVAYAGVVFPLAGMVA